MKKDLFLIIFSFVSFSSFCQTTDSVFSFSLTQAIEYAYNNQKVLINAKLDAEIAHEQVKEITGIGLPQLTGSFDIKDYVALPTSVIPSEFFGGNPGEFTPITFGTQWNATAGLNASQLLFDPSYLVGVKASKAFRDLSQKNVTRTKIETYYAVSKAYYAVLVSTEKTKLLDANVIRVKKLKDDTKAMYDNGFVEKIDLDRVTVVYNNILTEQSKVQRISKLSEYLLKFQMGMKMDAQIVLTDSLNYNEIKDLVISAEKPDVSKRIEYSILESQKSLHEFDLKRYKAAYYPALNAYGSLSTTALRDDFDVFRTEGKWYPTGLIGATLSINLFDGTQREHKIHQANLGIRKIENDLANAENAMTMEVVTSKTLLQNALDTYNSQKENLDLANDVVRVSKVKYDQGVGSNLEVVVAETALREGLTNYYNALYEALVAKVDLDKSLGNIR